MNESAISQDAKTGTHATRWIEHFRLSRISTKIFFIAAIIMNQAGMGGYEIVINESQEICETELG